MVKGLVVHGCRIKSNDWGHCSHRWFGWPIHLIYGESSTNSASNGALPCGQTMNPVRESTDVLMFNLVGLITNHTTKPTTLPYGRTTLDCPTSSAQILIEKLEKVSSTHTVNIYT